MDRSKLGSTPGSTVPAGFARAHFAYQLAHVASAVRGAVITAVLVVVTAVLHDLTAATWLVAGVLGITLAVFGWRGGALRRGGLLGVKAGALPLVAPAAVALATQGLECFGCPSAPSTGGLVACLGISALVGAVVGHRATTDPVPRSYAVAATVSAALTGSLGCGITGLGGATGIAVALFAGSLTGWLTSARAT
jgi:hypothetical protein